MTIGFLINNYGRGGAQRVISLISPLLKANGQLLIQYDGSLAYPYMGKVVNLDCQSGALSKMKFGRAVMRLIALRKISRKENITTLVSFLVRTNILAAFAKRFGLFSGKVILNEVTVPSQHRSYSSLQKWLLKNTYGWADKIIVPSNGILEDLVSKSGLPKKLIKVIPNPVDSNTIRRLAQEKYKVDVSFPSAITIVAVGRLTASKGFDLLIRSLSEVRQSIDVSLIIIGEGEEREKLVRLASDLQLNDYIYWSGWVDNPFSIMARSDLFVLSSRYEGFGNVIVEAMCCGLPVISFDCPGGPREILGDGEFGLLVPNGDIDSLSEAILNLFQDAQLREHFRQQSRLRAQEYDVEKIASIWEAELTHA